LMKFHPSSFEFTEAFLVLLFDHSNLCLFGTFLCDSEKQRQAAEVTTKTASFWDYVKFLERTRAVVLYNPYFIPRSGRPVARYSVGEIPFWFGLYNRFLIQTPDARTALAQTQELFQSGLSLAKKFETLKIEYEKKTGQSYKGETNLDVEVLFPFSFFLRTGQLTNSTLT
jgi:hypothetical protein